MEPPKKARRTLPPRPSGVSLSSPPHQIVGRAVFSPFLFSGHSPRHATDPCPSSRRLELNSDHVPDEESRVGSVGPPPNNCIIPIFFPDDGTSLGFKTHEHLCPQVLFESRDYSTSPHTSRILEPFHSKRPDCCARLLQASWCRG